MGFFDFLREKIKKNNDASSESNSKEKEYVLGAEDKDDSPKIKQEELKYGNNQIEKGPDLDYYYRKIQIEMHLKDYRRAASLYHAIQVYTNKLNMLLLYVESEKDKEVIQWGRESLKTLIIDGFKRGVHVLAFINRKKDFRSKGKEVTDSSLKKEAKNACKCKSDIIVCMNLVGVC